MERTDMSIKDIILGTQRERVITDSLTVGGIICPLIKMNQWDVFLYGAGKDVSSVILYFWNLNIDIKGIFDCDIKKEGRKILGQVPIIYPQNVIEKFDSEKNL